MIDENELKNLLNSSPLGQFRALPYELFPEIVQHVPLNDVPTFLGVSRFFKAVGKNSDRYWEYRVSKVAQAKKPQEFANHEHFYAYLMKQVSTLEKHMNSLKNDLIAISRKDFFARFKNNKKFLNITNEDYMAACTVDDDIYSKKLNIKSEWISSQIKLLEFICLWMMPKMIGKFSTDLLPVMKFYYLENLKYFIKNDNLECFSSYWQCLNIDYEQDNQYVLDLLSLINYAKELGKFSLADEILKIYQEPYSRLNKTFSTKLPEPKELSEKSSLPILQLK